MVQIRSSHWGYNHELWEALMRGLCRVRLPRCVGAALSWFPSSGPRSCLVIIRLSAASWYILSSLADNNLVSAEAKL